MSYQGTPQMTTTGAQFVQEKAGVPGQPRQWKHGLCDCFSDCGGQTKSRLNNGNGCFGNGCLFCCSIGCGISWIIGGMTRGEIRARHNIDGSCLGDYCTHCCCPLCALVQENREVHES
ncbi:9539_t:CDS:2 [Gigaspora rosea]|nr:9539_t:CDS:2 [Gigaspora rosea]